MERRKARGSIDEFATVKAAAWAWYQHGSGSDTRVMSEYDVTRTKKTSKPSRFKVEAIRQVQETLKVSNSDTTAKALPSSTHLHADHSLLDTYEIDRISRQLALYIGSSHGKGCENSYGNSKDQLRVMSSTDQNRTSDVKRKQQMMKKSRVFCFRPPAICGSWHDAVDGRSRSSS